ncbi:MAG: hypothetical protein ABIH66_07015 [bacterium]
MEPVPGRPVIVSRGEAFAIRIDAPEEVELDKVLLGPAVSRGAGGYEARIVGTRAGADGEPYEVLAKLPYVLPAGLYDLIVQFKMGSVNYIEERAAAVNIVDSEPPFSFAVLGYPDSPGQGGFTIQAISKLKNAMLELSTLTPDFVVFLGGMGSGPWEARNYRVLRDVLREELLAPVVALPMAGDLSATHLLNFRLSDGAEQWKSFFPLKPYSFDRAGYRFVFMFAEPCGDGSRSTQEIVEGCIGEESVAWLKKLVEDAAGLKLVVFLPNIPLAPGSGGFRGSVENPLDRRSEKALLEILKGRGATLFTSGMSRDAVLGGAGDVRIINTGRDEAGFLPRFRIITAGAEGLDGLHYLSLPNAIPFGRLRVTYAKPNNGAARKNRIVVTSEIGRDLAGLRAIAVMAPLKTGGYKIDGAKVKMRSAETKHVFVLSFDLKNGGQKVITIEKREKAASRKGKTNDRSTEKSAN